MQFDQLGPYRLGKKLGQGGMGAVYEGSDVDSGEPAAVKVLSPSLAAEAGFRVRFEAEIESLKKLRHPHIVRLFGYGEQGGTLFYAMELVPGTSLEDELRGGRRFDWREVTQIAIQLCKALKHAHDHGVIHRDLKPANLLLTPTGEIKLSDFGIARLFGNTRMTTDGGVLGTAEYMAPEQADGRTVTDRCDQYSLGGVMYALLTGRPPFRAKSMVEMLQLQRFAEPEPVTRFAPGTPPELAQIVHQLLDKDPQKRFANTLVLGRLLEAMQRGLSVATLHEADPNTPLSTFDPDSPDYDPRAMTMAASQIGAKTPAKGATGTPTEATMAYGTDAKKPAAARSDTGQPRDPNAVSFTKIDERSDDGGHDWLASMLTPQTLGLVAALALLLGGGWYLMRPQSADQLFTRIETTTADGDLDSIKRAQADIDAFLDRYPDDTRAERVRALADEARQSTPIERAFNEAKRFVIVNPDEALRRFTALIAVYDDGAQGSEATRRYIKLARAQQARLEQQINRYAEESRQLLAARLSKAQQLAHDDPAAARKIYQGIVDLYAQKPWAEDVVRQAQGALDATAHSQAARP